MVTNGHRTGSGDVQCMRAVDRPRKGDSSGIHGHIIGQQNRTIEHGAGIDAYVASQHGGAATLYQQTPHIDRAAECGAGTTGCGQCPRPDNGAAECRCAALAAHAGECSQVDRIIECNVATGSDRTAQLGSAGCICRQRCQRASPSYRATEAGDTGRIDLQCIATVDAAVKPDVASAGAGKGHVLGQHH